METKIVNAKDQIVMGLVHYLVTKENYSPIVVQGAKNEIWLENLSAKYKVIRINSNYIHNDEQYEFDVFKVKHVIKQIKKRTLSFKLNALNICLDLAERVDVRNIKNVDTIKVLDNKHLVNNETLKTAFPDIKEDSIKAVENFDLFVNATNDINDKTEKENKIFEEVFSPKKIIVTNIIIALCIIMFSLTYILGEGPTNILTLLNLGANNGLLVKNGEFYRLITSIFLHAGIIHLLVNMYSLYIVGNQIETYLGKWKFLGIYLLSGASGSLLSVLFNPELNVSVGASGAIFGLLGALLYFGYHYRLYLNDALKTQIIPIILINLFIGFSISGIDNAAHIGGLIGGYLAAVAFGVRGKSDKKESINGFIALALYFAFLAFMLFR